MKIGDTFKCRVCGTKILFHGVGLFHEFVEHGTFWITVDDLDYQGDDADKVCLGCCMSNIDHAYPQSFKWVTDFMERD